MATNDNNLLSVGGDGKTGKLIFLVEHARADKGARQGPCDGVEVQGRSGVEREYLEYTATS